MLGKLLKVYWNQPPEDDGVKRPKKETESCQIKQSLLMELMDRNSLAAARW